MSSLVASDAQFDPYEYASDFVRGYCNQQFDFVADDTILIDPRPDGTAQLPEMPVTAVTLVEANLADPITGLFTWQTLTNYQWNRRGLIWDMTQITPPDSVSPRRSWPFLPSSLRVTYSHGFATIPIEIQAIVARLAAQYASNPRFLQSRKVGEVATVFGAVNGGVTLRDTDEAILDRYVVQEVS